MFSYVSNFGGMKAQSADHEPLQSLTCTGCGSSCGLLTSDTGSISDGSGSSYYANSANCKWIIAPSGAVSLQLTFLELSTEQGYDYVRVFTCTSTTEASCSLSSELTGLYRPGYLDVQSGRVMIQFTSDSIVTEAGFTMQWTATFSVISL
jgi:hypothetical protein